MHPDLLPHLATNQTIRVTSDFSDHPVSGYLLSLSDELALFHAFADFDPDGYIILRTDDVDEVRRSEFEVFWDEMLAAEQALRGLVRPPEINLDSMRDAVVSVSELGLHMIIETEGTAEESDEVEKTFFLGEVVEAHEDFVEFHGYDGLGMWTPQPDIIWYSEIICIKFDTRYANTFSRYVPSRPAH